MIKCSLTLTDIIDERCKFYLKITHDARGNRAITKHFYTGKCQENATSLYNYSGKVTVFTVLHNVWKNCESIHKNLLSFESRVCQFVLIKLINDRNVS